MKIKFVICFMLVASYGFAQIKLTEIGLNYGAINFPKNFVNQGNYLDYFDDATYFKDELSGYSTSNYYSNIRTFTNLSFRFANEVEQNDKKFASSLEIALNYSSYFSHNYSLTKITTTPIKELANEPGLGVLTLDSVYNSRVSAYTNGSVYGFSIGKYFRSSNKSKFTFEYGFTANYNFYNTESASAGVIEQYRIRYGNTNSYGNGYSVIKNEGKSLNTKSGYSFSVNMPMSISYQFSRKQDFLQMFTAFYQFGLGVGMVKLESLNEQIHPRMQNSIGLRIAVN